MPFIGVRRHASHLNGLFPREVELYFDAVDGLAHEQLVKLGVVSFAFTEWYAVARQTFDEFAHAIAIETKVINSA